ncbi:hypothetical protein [uncultured Shewanella sp.]|uniref:hypothetical protein n=1 Tax=uncultured Shewanella sp. TaxID=173975 RepID=UPI002607625D|nr:hypothetical protein [uncultured Shewanella sp.]
MSDLNNTKGVSSCVSGEFTPLKEETSSHHNTWAFCFNKNQNQISLNVTINTPTMLVDMSNQHLEAPLTLEDLNQLLVWLFQVKTSMQHAAKKANVEKGDKTTGATGQSTSE